MADSKKADSRKKIFLIDGSAFLYRAFHAIRSLNTSKGHPTNATFGFARILLKLLRDNTPEYAVVIFDVKGPTFRHQMYDQYKANRPPMPEDLAVQIPDIKRVIEAFNIPIEEKQGFEADDLVGTYAKLAREKGFEVVMVTGDKDFMQLVSDHCTLWDPMKDTITDVAKIKKDMGIDPIQFIDILGLAGDSSDNIPGVRGVGPKTAIKLIAQFGSIENLYENIDELKKKKKLYENLSTSKDIVFLSRDLATIDQSVEVTRQIEDFKIDNINTKKAFELFREFEFKTLAAEFAQKTDSSEKKYTLVTKIKDLENLAHTLEKEKIFAVDTETTSKTPMDAQLVGISFSFKENQGFYIPIGHTSPDDIAQSDDLDQPDQINQPDKDDILRIFKPILENPDIKKVGQNIKYDYIVLSRFGITLQGIAFDTMIASYLLNPATRGHSLDRIAMNLFGYKTISYEDVTGKGKNQIGFQDVPIAQAVNYASEDADITFMAYQQFKKQIQDQNLSDLMEKIEIPLITVLANMEMEGIKVDEDALQHLSQTFDLELKSLEKEIYALAGEEFNINSSQQLGVILFEKLQLKTAKKTKKKTGYSTDVEVLTKLAQTHELPEKLLRYRTLGKLKSTYADSLQQLINKETGRIHTSFNQTITVTGRLSSSHPNLQNIPIRKKEGKEIRKAFIPKKGHTLISADYSQIELRILAHYAEDDILIEAFNEGEDIHTRTALEVFQVLPEFVTADLRSQAKAINFGIVYGMSGFRLSNELSISRKMAKAYIDNYFKRYAGVKKFIDTTIEETRKTGEVSTLFGRKRRLDDINSSNANVRNFAQRAAINTPIQGSAADLIKMAMIKMADALKANNMASKMLLSVHDEIIFECPLEEKEQLIDLAKTVMEQVHPLKVPLTVNFGIGENWAQAH
ncbi:DNA polymerase I [Desulfobacula toluolica]|uniref:DNA polymerase I n=1 Tax=Desulfobacula toluolica (strain DSM 7467 / Tol2) TaxID=651182 RepID=K0NC96_DESTT|nr:DNA polymerase I [Desulfobacula toluolica]CCK82044.1 PolA: DNA polymerase I [Desulfobacula toluolica Tol2]